MEYKIVKVPCISKNLLVGKNTKYKIRGNAYYFIDDKFQVFHQYLILENGFTYRKTCSSWYGRTKHSINNKIKLIREHNQILFKTKKINNKTEIAKFTNKDKLKILNNLIIDNFSTVLSVIGLIHGSNVSGAELNKKASPLIIYDEKNKDWEFNCLRFTNFFNRYSHNKAIANLVKKELDNSISKWWDVLDQANSKKIISLDDYFKLIKNDKDRLMWFYDVYNFDSAILKERQEEKTKSQIWVQAIRKWTKNQKWIDCTNEKVELYKKGIIEKDKLKISLRNIYTTFANIRYQEACNNNILVYESKNIEYENAHIVQFSYYFNNEEFLKATDPNNLLFLDPNTHKIYDKNKITINLDGMAEINPNLSKLDREIIEKQYKDKQIISPDWLKFQYQNSMPYEYLKINYKYWKNYKKNLQ